MKQLIILIVWALGIAALLSGCSGGSSSSNSSTGANPTAAAACNQTPTLGSTSFGNGCFK